jgi:hypothetical protein
MIMIIKERSMGQCGVKITIAILSEANYCIANHLGKF